MLENIRCGLMTMAPLGASEMEAEKILRHGGAENLRADIADQPRLNAPYFRGHEPGLPGGDHAGQLIADRTAIMER